MKKFITLCIAAICLGFTSLAQVAINTDGTLDTRRQ